MIRCVNTQKLHVGDKTGKSVHLVHRTEEFHHPAEIMSMCRIQEMLIKERKLHEVSDTTRLFKRASKHCKCPGIATPTPSLGPLPDAPKP